MAFEIWDWDTFKRKAQEDEEMNGDKYRHQFDVAKAWFKSGGRVTLHRWAMRRDFETHLIQKGKNIIHAKVGGRKQTVLDAIDELVRENLLDAEASLRGGYRYTKKGAI